MRFRYLMVSSPLASDDSSRISTSDVLASVPLFAGLDEKAIEALAAFTFRKQFQPGELIVEEGRTGNGLFIIVTGKAEVIKGLDEGQPRTVATLGAGEPIGEMALLGEWPRSASVRAIEDTDCLGMDRWIFLDHLDKQPKLALRMLQILALRLAETGERLVE
jgi:CRP-like cAMP-binding protein